MPILPPEDVGAMKREFARLDAEGHGYVDASILIAQYGLATCRDMDLLAACQDGIVDLHEFMRLFCPADHRLPETESSARRWFTEILSFETSDAYHHLTELST